MQEICYTKILSSIKVTEHMKLFAPALQFPNYLIVCFFVECLSFNSAFESVKL